MTTALAGSVFGLFRTLPGGVRRGRFHLRLIGVRAPRY